MTDGISLASYAAAFGAGLVSVLSPCVMPLMPAYLSLISGLSVEEIRGAAAAEDDEEPAERERRRRDLRRRVLLGCAGFVAGFSTVFVLLGASATAIGRVLQAWQVEVLGVPVGAVQLAGLVIIVMGLHLIGWVRIPLLYRDTRVHHGGAPRSFLGTLLVGAAFAFGWSPCVGPILGGILTVAGSRETVGQGMALLAVYSAGLGVPFFLAGWSIEFFFRALERMRRHFRRVEIVSGALLVAVGVLVLTDRLTALNAWFGFLNRVVETAEGWML
ncbi:MAG: cytochrome c biogenesis protein CcdA [Myxococcota bacterium]|nr:cytochrome c biogenesis protein CcdA [Myxococcota bacterium]